MRGLRESDRQAHAELCARFGAALFGYAAARLGGDEERAEEVMVQTLVDATRNIGLYDPARSSLAAWLYGIARRHIQTQRRQQSRRKTIPSSAQVSLESMGEIADTDDLENDVAARLEARRKVARIATLLSDLEMEVLLLRYVDGLSVKEVAGIVGRSEKAVDSLLHRAKQRAQKGVTESAE